MEIRNNADMLIDELSNECAKGDVNAFRKLVSMRSEYVFGLAFRILWDEEDAKDAVQEIFIKVWKNIGQYDSRSKFTTWLYRITANHCIDKMRSNEWKGHQLKKSDFDLDLLRADAQNPEQIVENRELAERLSLLTGELPETQRMVFILRDLQGLSIAETAEALEISSQSVKANLSYARSTLRQKIKRLEVQ